MIFKCDLISATSRLFPRHCQCFVSDFWRTSSSVAGAAAVAAAAADGNLRRLVGGVPDA